MWFLVCMTMSLAQVSQNVATSPTSTLLRSERTSNAKTYSKYQWKYPTEKATSSNSQFNADLKNASTDMLGKPTDDDAYTKIVNGEDSVAGAYPWFVLLEIYSCGSGYGKCGGSLIAPNKIVSAAHCFQGEISHVDAYVGAHSINAGGDKGEKRTINASCITTHPDYDNSELNNDIAVLVFTDPFPTASVLSIDSRSAQGLCPNQNCVDATIIGFGDMNQHPLDEEDPEVETASILQEATITLVATSACETDLDNLGRGSVSLSTTHVCAEGTQGKDTCQGDSGGPMVVQLDDDSWSLVGVTSWGFGCGNAWPSVYTHVPSFQGWLDSIDGCLPNVDVELLPGMFCGDSSSGNTGTYSNFVGGPQKDVLFRVEILSDGIYTFDACDSNSDTVLSVYSTKVDDSLGQTIDMIMTQNDDNPDICGEGEYSSYITIRLHPGTYVVGVEGFDDDVSYSLRMRCADGAHTTCRNNQEYNGPFDMVCSEWDGYKCTSATDIGYTVAEQNTLIEECPYSCRTCDVPEITCNTIVTGLTCDEGPVVDYYDIDVTHPGSFTFHTCSSDFDTKIFLFKYTSTTTTVLIVDNDDDTSCAQVNKLGSAIANEDLVVGRYLLKVSGYGGDSGKYELEVGCELESTPAPRVDPCFESCGFRGRRPLLP